MGVVVRFEIFSLRCVMPDTSIVTSALRFAAEIYTGSFRPDSKRTPFVTHLSETADLVKRAGGTSQEIAAAWLHDLVEDGHITLAAMEERFEAEIAILVDAVTDPEHIRDQPIALRKAQQVLRLAEAPEGARRIKLAEQISILRALAVERPLSWTIERTINYVAGAQRVARICQGISPVLDTEFVAVHAAAEKAIFCSSSVAQTLSR
jgi:GTP diphosphokinase / guanosine-3',5'-bis(diphosphate) 3'-diphosphatase